MGVVREVYQSESILKDKTASFKKSQILLKKILKKIFAEEGIFFFCVVNKKQTEVFEDYRHPDIVFPSGFPVELDFFYPRLNIAIEYQV